MLQLQLDRSPTFHIEIKVQITEVVDLGHLAIDSLVSQHLEADVGIVVKWAMSSAIAQGYHLCLCLITQ